MLKILNLKKSVEKVDKKRAYDPFFTCHYCDPCFDFEDIKMLLLSLRTIYQTFDEESQKKEIYLNFAIPDTFLYASWNAEHVVIPNDLKDYLNFETVEELEECAMKLQKSYELYQSEDDRQ